MSVDPAWGTSLSVVAVAAISAFSLYVSNKNTQAVKAVVADPVTGIAATHSLVNGQSEVVKEQAKKFEEQSARFEALLAEANKTIADLNAARLKDSQSREAPAQVGAQPVPATVTMSDVDLAIHKAAAVAQPAPAHEEKP